MLSQVNLINKILGSMWNVWPGTSLTTAAKRHAGADGRGTKRRRLFQPPPWQNATELPAHLLRDIGLDRGRS